MTFTKPQLGLLIGLFLVCVDCLPAATDYYAAAPFGTATRRAKKSDVEAIGKWWENLKEDHWFRTIPREQALAFAIYTVDGGTLKLTAQCFPLLPDEPKSVTLEFKRDGRWQEAAQAAVDYPGWSAHFRIEDWGASKDTAYRLRLGELSSFEGQVRRDPVGKSTLTVANMSCNSPRDKQRFSRTAFIGHLKQRDPDLLFFAGDQNYTHERATFGWLQFGMQFRDIMKDRPTITIPDDHDIGQPNLWGEGGKHAKHGGGADGGYMFPPSFVNMVQRQQTWHLPDAFDPAPVKRGIGVYFTDLTWGGISFAILEDRKFKSGPMGKIPKMGPRPDHINDPQYDRKAIDLPGLKLLGDRQLKFLDAWARDWTGAEMKVALSQTAFCGAVHCHGQRNNRLLADLDCNGWPQAGRLRALQPLRAARATHLCGDQHLAVVVRHGLEEFRDGPIAFTSPALVNTIYGRWWHPEDEKAGGGAKIESQLPWTGDYLDGLGNKITMHAYANPGGKGIERGDGYGIAVFNKARDTVRFECWPRFSDPAGGDAAQFPGWPLTFKISDNDGRAVHGHLKEVRLPVANAVVELTHAESGELVYCRRVDGDRFEAPVFAPGSYTLRAGKDRPDNVLIEAAKID